MSSFISIQNFNPFKSNFTAAINTLAVGGAVGFIWCGKKVATSVEEEGFKKTLSKIAGYTLIGLGAIGGVISGAGLAFSTGLTLSEKNLAVGIISGGSLGIVSVGFISLYTLTSINEINGETEEPTLWTEQHIRALGNHRIVNAEIALIAAEDLNENS